MSAPTMTTVATCPTCQGNGELFVARAYGRTAPEPYVTRTCGACGGTGSVAAVDVATCGGCTEAFWVDEVCTHNDEPLCVDCRPYGVCWECVEDRQERDR